MTDDKNKLRWSQVLKMPDENLSKLFDERAISIPVSGLHSLKKELIYSIGEERTKGVFIRYGWHTGVSEGEKARETFDWNDEIELLQAGFMFHKMHGHVDEVEIEDVKYNSGKVIYLKALWRNSYEADEHLKFNGTSDEPVCHTLCGFASGYLTSAFNVPLLVKEVKCRAMGDEDCEVVCKPIEDWGDKEHEYTYYQSSSMIEELDELTAKLKIERDYLSVAQDLHKRMIEIIVSKKESQKIVDLLHQTTGLPIFIEDELHNITVQSEGINIDFKLDELSTDSTHYFEISPEIGLLRAPIYFENKIRGYCTFMYTDGNKPNQLEYNIIDQTSLVSSIILLHDDIKLQTAQNIRRSFLNDILNHKLSGEELYKIINYLNFNPEGDYWMFTLEKYNNEESLSSDIELNEEVLRHINTFFKQRGIETFACQISGKLTIAMEWTANNRKIENKTRLILKLLKYCETKFSPHKFYVGLSSVQYNVQSLPRLFKETEIALNTKTEGDRILYYEDLGVEKVLFHNQDDQLIDSFVEEQLSSLFQSERPDELISTLKHYIENGMSINATSKEISMSVSGLRYRLEKISELLNIELDDTKSLFSVYMAITVNEVKCKKKQNPGLSL